MQYNNQAYLSLVWKDPKERKQYLIGRLSKGEEFVFKYDDEIKNALKAGFHPLLAFSNLKQEYHSKLMFPSFSSRLPDPKRKDINKILNKYNLVICTRHTRPQAVTITQKIYMIECSGSRSGRKNTNEHELV